MNHSEIRLLFDYNYWANQCVLDHAARVTPAQLSAPAPVSHGSLMGALVHILSAEVVWRQRCQEGVSPPALLTARNFASLATLKTHWRAEEQDMRAYLAGLTAADLRRRVSYTNTNGVAFQTVLWQILAHVVNHGTQFRSEAAVVLTLYGESPGDLDLIAYIRSLK